MNTLRVATLNTFGGSLDFAKTILRYLAITDYFGKSSVDVIHFQEVFTYFHLYLSQPLLRDYPYRVYQKSILGPKGGLVTFSRYPLEKVRYVDYVRNNIPYLDNSFIEILTQRGALMAKIRNSGVSLVNTHLTAVVGFDWSKKSRYYKELHSEIGQFHKVVGDLTIGGIVVTSGDFNIAKGSDLFRDLVRLRNLFDPFEADLAPTRHQEFVKEDHQANRIDYLFVFGDRKHYIVEAKKTLFTDKVRLGKDRPLDYISDHVGLQVSLRLKIK